MYQITVTAEDGRSFTKEFNTKEELDAFFKKAVELSGAKVKKTLTVVGTPTVEVFEEEEKWVGI